jgi:hypothetical protein
MFAKDAVPATAGTPSSETVSSTDTVTENF